MIPHDCGGWLGTSSAGFDWTHSRERVRGTGRSKMVSFTCLAADWDSSGFLSSVYSLYGNQNFQENQGERFKLSDQILRAPSHFCSLLSIKAGHKASLNSGAGVGVGWRTRPILDGRNERQGPIAK